jgi:hypothetical protein
LALLCGLALGNPKASAQSPSSFDGDSAGTATLVGTNTDCATIPKVAMTIRAGQVEIHEFLLNGPRTLYKGSVNASGEVCASHLSTLPATDLGKGGAFVIVGTIRDNIFTGQRSMGRGRRFNIQMTKTLSR